MEDLLQNEVVVRSGLGGVKEVSEPLITILSEAIAEGATDIHLDPFAEGKHVRYRVDGVVHEKAPIPGALRKRLLNQIKVLLDLNIDKSFVPEEGFISMEMEGTQHDMRVTIAPVGDREAIHFRFLSSSRNLRDLVNLGMRGEDLQAVQRVIEAPYGLVLVAGGTGSGKTTTLYSLANTLKHQNLIVTSIEDPVEFRLPRVRQLEVSEKHGFTMHEGLRIILRMDPDVIMVGEIRDRDSATTAARAGLSGQLVIATMHARNASMAVDALGSMDVPRYMIGGALRLVIHQNLVLRLCQACAGEAKPTAGDRELLERHQVPVPQTVRRAVGCAECRGYGHKGRIAVFELTPIDQSLGHDIAAGVGARKLSSRLHHARRASMAQDVLHKAAAGEVSLDVAKHFVQSLGE